MLQPWTRKFQEKLVSGLLPTTSPPLSLPLFLVSCYFLFSKMISSFAGAFGVSRIVTDPGKAQEFKLIFIVELLCSPQLFCFSD